MFGELPQWSPNIFNLHVSHNYVKPWGVWHAIREFYQNLYDGCLSVVQYNTDMLQVQNIEEGKFIFYDMTNQNNPNPIGMVHYKGDDKQTLMFKNELRGMMTTRCLLLGGSDTADPDGKAKHEKTDASPIAGEFGEGFKLATLALLRSGCPLVNVTVCRDTWKFFLRADPAFANETCLWVEILKNVEPEGSKFVEARIEGISRADFASARRKLLRITDRDPNKIHKTSRGWILADEQYASHVYVRGIYVSNAPCGWKQCVGYDALNLSLDRDRMAFQESNTYLSHTAQIAGETLKHLVSSSGGLGMARRLVRKFYPVICGSEVPGLYAHINKDVAKLFWDRFQESHPNCQPMHVYCQNDSAGKPYNNIAVKLPKLYVPVDYYLLHVLMLTAPEHFKPPIVWLSEAINRGREQYAEADQQQIQAAIQVITAMPSLELNNIVILKNEEHHNYISCIKDRCLYLPKAVVDNELNLLEPMGPTNTPLSRALQLIAIRTKSSECYFAQL